MAASAWDEACAEELQLSQESSAAITDAENQRTQSTSGGVCSDDDEPNVARPSRWWAGVLKAAARGMGYSDTVLPPRELVVVSGCSGCGAEAFVMKARAGFKNFRS